jgi:hypothetical protein
MEESAAVTIAEDLLSRHVAAWNEVLSARRIDSPPSAEWIRETCSDFISSSIQSDMIEQYIQHVTSRAVRPHWDVSFLVRDEDHLYGPTPLAILTVRIDEETGDAVLSNDRHDWFPLGNQGPVIADEVRA